MARQTEAQIAVAMIAETKNCFPILKTCSLDKKFRLFSNQGELTQQFDQLTFPGNSNITKARQAVGQAKEFVNARRAHSVIEFAINAL